MLKFILKVSRRLIFWKTNTEYKSSIKDKDDDGEKENEVVWRENRKLCCFVVINLPGS